MENNVKKLNLEEFDPLSDVNSTSRRSASIRPSRPPPPPPTYKARSATISNVSSVNVDPVITQPPRVNSSTSFPLQHNDVSLNFDTTDHDGGAMSRNRSLEHASSFQDYSDKVALSLYVVFS